MKNAQRGVSLISMLVIGGVLAFGGVIGAQVLPTLVEYQAIVNAAKRASEGATIPEVRNLFDRSAAVDDIKSVTGRDLEITKEDDKVVVSFAYEREIHMGGPAYLLLRYKGSSR